MVGVAGDVKIGIVRFDRSENDSYEVSINVAPELRGQGMGRLLLQVAVNRLRERWPLAPVVAVVRSNNVASLKLFSACGFEQVLYDGTFFTFHLRSRP